MNDKNVKNNWTIMVYISADDVLANFAIDSLNQLRRAAGKRNIVMALFDPNDGSKKAFRYRFDGRNKEDTLQSVGTTITARDMADPRTLTRFVNWASKPLKEREGRHYCLVLWGHGTELLLDQDLSKRRKRYLTPANLERALERTRFNENNKLDIVALDACSMSMVELASALQGCVRFMVASQDEVPDVSFPYEQILKGLKGRGGNVKNIGELIPQLYLESFRDYLVTSRNGMKEIMLSSLNLEELKTITDPVKNLGGSLLRSVADKDVCKAVLLARQRSRDFVLGLFVDLYDFCKNLPKSFEENGCQDKDHSKELTAACAHIRKAIDDKKCIIANETRQTAKDCHGLSIYFPYSVEKDEKEQTKRLLGENETGILNLPLVKGGRDNQAKARNGRIEELEADFNRLRFFQEDDGWGSFIKEGWSLILARTFPRKLDLHYSAQQCARNLLPLSEKTLLIPSKRSEKKRPQRITRHSKKWKLQLVHKGPKKEAPTAPEPRHRRVG